MLSRLFQLPVFFALAAAIGAPAFAQDWPSKPISIVMGFPAGSGVDIVARTLQESMEKSLNARVVTEYRAGAGGNIASDYVAKARADGYTILLGTAATHGVNAALYRNLPFDVEADFTPIAPLVDVSNVLTINPEVIDVKTVGEFIDRVKANPGKYNFASTGNGTGTHLAFAEFNAKAGLNMQHVPYKGSVEAIQGMIKGDVCCLFAQVQTVFSTGVRTACACWVYRRRRASTRYPRFRRLPKPACQASRAIRGSACWGRKGSIQKSLQRSTVRCAPHWKRPPSGKS